MIAHHDFFLGIGPGRTVFSVVNALLFRPSAGSREPVRIVRLLEHQTALNQMAVLSAADLTDYAQATPAFERVAAFHCEGFTLTGGGDPESVSAIAISPGRLDIVGARIVQGRTFLPEENLGIRARNPGSGRRLEYRQRRCRRNTMVCDLIRPVTGRVRRECDIPFWSSLPRSPWPSESYVRLDS